MLGTISYNSRKYLSKVVTFIFEYIFIYDMTIWQALSEINQGYGDLLMVLVTAISVYIIYKNIRNQQILRQREQFNRLVAIIYELRMIIKRCEMYMNFLTGKEQKKSYNRIIIHDFLRSQKSKVLDIKTTKEICQGWKISRAGGNITYYDWMNVKWARVEEIIKYIDKQSYSEDLIKLRYELSK